MMAKKKYYQSPRDRMDEGEGMVRYEMKKKMKKSKKGGRVYENPYAMLHRDDSKHAGMPDSVIIKNYPKNSYIDQSYGDDLESIDRCFNEAVRGANKQRARKKY